LRGWFLPDGLLSWLPTTALDGVPGYDFDVTRQEDLGSSSWSGNFTFGSLWAAYVGPAGESAPHAHVAVQVVVATEPRGRITLIANRRVTGRAFIIRPLTRHALESSGRIWSIYLEASSPLGRLLRPRLEDQPVVAVSRVLMRLLERRDEPATWLRKVEASVGLGLPAIDPRLQQALRELLQAPGSLRIDEAARSAGLSTARLRAIAREQLGVPLATWLLSQKLDRAGRALANGMGLAEAAQEGGFSDQPHFARTMHRMFGMTPSEAGAALR
jgi:AraC-like DNA-binding protein